MTKKKKCMTCAHKMVEKKSPPCSKCGRSNLRYIYDKSLDNGVEFKIPTVHGCGVLIVHNGFVLLGERSDGQGWCAAGGKVEKGETPKQAAKRELKEEFQLVAKRVYYLGHIEGSALMHGKMCNYFSHIYLCKEYLGTPVVKTDEMLQFKWAPLDKVLESDELFPATRKTIMAYEAKCIREGF